MCSSRLLAVKTLTAATSVLPARHGSVSLQAAQVDAAALNGMVALDKDSAGRHHPKRFPAPLR